MLQRSGLPGSLRVTRARSVGAGVSFSQMVSAGSHRQLGVLGHVRLHEQDRPLRVEPGGEQPDRHVDRALRQGRGVVGLRDGVQVNHAEEAVVLMLQAHPVLHRAQIVADVQLARGLDTGEDARHGLTTYGGGGERRKVRELKDLVDVARRAAGRAAAFLRDTTPPPAADWIEKGRHDFVTQADRRGTALVGTGFPLRQRPILRRSQAQFAAVMGATSGIRRAGAAALDLVDVAAGRLDCFWELTLAPWDVAAGVVLVREAGGIVTTLEGSDDVLRHGSVVAGNRALHAWLMELLRNA